MSVDLSWTVDDAGGVRFVACHVHNEADVPRRVRIDSRLAGPVLPPRRSGVPEAGWDRDGVTIRLDPGEKRGIGFASVAPAADPPIEIADIEPVAGRETEPQPDTPTKAIRTLGEHRPPGDVVANDVVANNVAVAPGSAAPSESSRAAADGGATATPTQAAVPPHTSDPDSEDIGSEDADSKDIDSEGIGSETVRLDVVDSESMYPEHVSPTTADPSETTARSSHSESCSTAIGPDRIDDWFDAIERRIERAERLTDGDLDSATEAVAALGGTDAVTDLDRRLSDDAALLRRVSERAASLAERAEGTDAPVEALERLA